MGPSKTKDFTVCSCFYIYYEPEIIVKKIAPYVAGKRNKAKLIKA